MNPTSSGLHLQHSMLHSVESDEIEKHITFDLSCFVYSWVVIALNCHQKGRERKSTWMNLMFHLYFLLEWKYAWRSKSLHVIPFSKEYEWLDHLMLSKANFRKEKIWYDAYLSETSYFTKIVNTFFLQKSSQVILSFVISTTFQRRGLSIGCPFGIFRCLNENLTTEYIIKRFETFWATSV